MDNGGDPRYRDPLSEVTRKERLYLLAVSTVAIIVVHTGLIPSEITTFGIKFAQADQRSLLIVLALVVTYFLAAFLVYAASDCLRWLELWRSRAAENYGKLLEKAAYRQSQNQLPEHPDLSSIVTEKKQLELELEQTKAGSREETQLEYSDRVRNLKERLKESKEKLREGVEDEIRRYFDDLSKRGPFRGTFRIFGVASSISSPVLVLRAIFEFALPILVGCYAIIILLISAFFNILLTL